MNQAQRIMSILHELPHRRGCPSSNLAALADRFGASSRTVHRDLALLAGAGYRIERDSEGYYLLPSEQPLPARLSADETAALLYAVQWAETAVPEGMRPDFASMADKLISMCSTHEAAMAALEPDHSINISPTQSDGSHALSNICLAIEARRRHRKLRGVYYSPDRDRRQTRIVHPYVVTYRGDAHYLVAYCELRRRVRTFRLDRFRDLEVTDQPADIPPEYDLRAHFSGAWEVTGGRRTTVVLLVSGKTARRMRYGRVHPSQQMSETHDGLQLRLKVATSEEFCAWVLGLGPDVEVISPKSLRRRIADLLEKNLAKYCAD
jgi:predicted DNA-binding transcriptional regulator YafY